MDGTGLGHFSLLEKIGEGGMGRVYKARDLGLDRTVAIKVLPESHSADPGRRARFVQEAKAASALNHPNIITIHEIGEQEGQTFIVMELVDGKPLHELIPDKGMRLTEALRIAAQVAGALTAAHAAGIVHRDLKPANIMVDHHGRVKVLDFGLAKLSASAAAVGEDLPTRTMAMDQPLTEEGAIVGSVPYMSPEQAEGKPVDARSDIFSFGAVLYEMITGQRAFRGESKISTLAAILDKEPPPASGISPTTPPELERLIVLCLRKDVNRRSQHMSDVKLALEELRDESESGKRARLAAPVLAGWRRWLWPAMAAASVAGVLLWLQHVWTGLPASRNSLIVLPFTNVTHDPDLEYVADGLSDSISDNLAQFPGMRVVARTTASTFKGGDLDIRKIGRDLKVRVIVMGKVSRPQGRLHVRAELVDSGDASEVWGQEYNGADENLLPIEQDIVHNLGEHLQVQRDSGRRMELARHTTQSREAYQWYLKGRYLLSRSSVTEIQSGIACFQRALEIDPAYGLAFTGLADSYWGLSGMYLTPKEAMIKAKVAAGRALEIDPTLPEAHVAIGVVRGWYEYDWDGSQREFERAIQLNPNDAPARLWRAWALVSASRFKEGLAEAQTAHELDPLSPFVETGLAQMYCYAGKLELAVAQLRGVTESDPKFFNGHHYLGTVYVAAKRYQEAVSELEQARRLDDQQPQPVAYLAYAHAMLGNRRQATLLRDQLVKLSKTRYVSGFLLAVASLGLDSDDRVMRSLEQAYEDRDDMLTVLGVDTLFARFRRDSRFTALLRKMGFSGGPPS